MLNLYTYYWYIRKLYYFYIVIKNKQLILTIMKATTKKIKKNANGELVEWNQSLRRWEIKSRY